MCVKYQSTLLQAPNHASRGWPLRQAFRQLFGGESPKDHRTAPSTGQTGTTIVGLLAGVLLVCFLFYVFVLVMFCLHFCNAFFVR